jgi:hypothetical protein
MDLPLSGHTRRQPSREVHGSSQRLPTRAADLGGPPPEPRTAQITCTDRSYGVVTLMTTVASSDGV